jgi:hypothetical protein
LDDFETMIPENVEDDEEMNLKNFEKMKLILTEEE